MFLQLGNHIFTLPFGIDSYSKTDDTTYAQHDLIGVKPNLQPTANNLEQISLSISLHAEFCNVEQTIADFKTSKDSFEVLPYLLGNGKYVGDFVITSITEEHVECFEEGTPYRATLSLSLLEYQVADRLTQQQNAARKKAFAVGDKKPVVQGLTQPPTIPQTSSVNMAAVNSEGNNINDAVAQYPDNVSQQDFIKTQIQNSLTNINNNLDAFNNQFSNVQYLFTDVTGVQTALTGMASAVTGFSFSNLNHLQQSNLNLQSANQTLQIAMVPLNYNIIDRRA